MMNLSLGNSLPLAVSLVWVTPVWFVLLGVVVALALLWAGVALLRLAAPKVAAIAWTTGKEAVWQPLFYLLLGFGAFMLVLFPFLPYNTFGEDVKVVKETGLTLIMLLAVLLALWTASTSIADELEGRTALTLLSKPISRRQFLLGKFLGVLGPVILLFIVLGALFLASVSFKVVYDARENSLPEPGWTECGREMAQIAPGLALAFFEAVIMASISVAIATRLPMLPNLAICASIYALGHLVPMLAASSAGRLAVVAFVADLLSTLLPALDNFDIYGAISTGNPVPGHYLLGAAVYCALYSTVAMLVALLLFEDRDLS
jgi:hypothetical protein